MATESKFKHCTLCNEYVLRVRFADHYLRAHLTSGNAAVRVTSVLDRKDNQNVR